MRGSPIVSARMSFDSLFAKATIQVLVETILLFLKICYDNRIKLTRNADLDITNLSTGYKKMQTLE